MIRAGVAQTDISCAPGVPLGGNAREDKAARGVHDPLHATVAVVESASDTCVLVALDLLAAPEPLVDAIASAVEESTGVPACRVVVSATHTHSGPDTLRGMGFDQQHYGPVDDWERDAVRAVAAAAASAQRDSVAASLRRASGDVPALAFNRRLAHRDGSTRMNWETLDPADVLAPLGPVDPELLVLVLDDDHGRALGAVMHFTLHPAVLVGHDHLVSADYVAEASAQLSGALGGAPVLFLNGALGDVNHLDHAAGDRATGFEESARIGDALGRAAVELLRTAEPVAAPASSSCSGWTVTLDQRTVDRPALQRARRLLDEQGDAPVEALDGIPEAAYARWTVTRGRRLAPLLDVGVRVVRLGPVVLVYLPFEVFVEFGLQLRDAFPHHVVRVVSLGGGYHGYLPTAAAFAQGGYEPTFGTSTVAAGQGEYLFHVVTTHLRALLGTDRKDEP